MKIVRFLYIAVAALCALSSCIREDEEYVEYIGVGNLVPEFTLTDVEGELHYYSDLAARHNFILFFVSTCPDCNSVMPLIHRTWQLLCADPSVSFICISRSEEPSELTEYWKPYGDMPLYYDLNRSAFNKFATHTVPRLYVVDGDGRVAWKADETLAIDAAQLAAIILSH